MDELSNLTHTSGPSPETAQASSTHLTEMPSTIRPNSSSSISKPSTLLQRKQKMTLSQTYYLAHVARGKLSKEAAKSDHDLRFLVGHANLLDGLMIDLAEAEREQESWFNQSVKGAAQSSTTTTSTSTDSPSQERHVRWSESLPAVTEDYEEEDSDASDDDDEPEATLATARSIAVPRATTVSTTAIVDDDEDEDMAEDEDEEAPELQLRRTPSHSSPPELLEESESESDSDSDSDMPPSPPAPELDVYASKPRRDAFTAQKAAPSASHDAFYEDGFYLPQRQQPISVY